MYKVLYDEAKQLIYQIDPKGIETIIADDFPSKPEFSPNKNKVIYISPLEWECLGSLYLFDLETGNITELIGPDEKQNIPKYALWLDNITIVLIIGFGRGTVNVGGNVFILNIESKELKRVTEYPEEIQITKLKMNTDFLELNGIKYIDDNYNQFVEFYDKLPLSEIKKINQ